MVSLTWVLCPCQLIQVMREVREDEISMRAHNGEHYSEEREVRNARHIRYTLHD